MMVAAPPIIRDNAGYIVLTEMHGKTQNHILPLISKFDIGKPGEVLNFFKSVTMRGQAIFIRKWADSIHDLIRIVSVPQKRPGYNRICPGINNKTDVGAFFGPKRKRYKPVDMDRLDDNEVEPSDPESVAPPKVVREGDARRMWVS